MKGLYYVTWQHGSMFPLEIEQLWTTVAANKRNIIPILDFIISRGLQEAAEPHVQIILDLILCSCASLSFTLCRALAAVYDASLPGLLQQFPHVCMSCP